MHNLTFTVSLQLLAQREGKECMNEEERIGINWKYFQKVMILKIQSATKQLLFGLLLLLFFWNIIFKHNLDFIMKP